MSEHQAVESPIPNDSILEILWEYSGKLFNQCQPITNSSEYYNCCEKL